MWEDDISTVKASITGPLVVLIALKVYRLDGGVVTSFGNHERVENPT